MTLTDRPTRRPSTRRVALAAALDLGLVLVFVLVGRRSHAHPADLAGIASTAWPFLVGLAAGWVVARAWRAPLAVVAAGLPVWVATVGGGMVLRHVAGQGTATPFVVVATVVVAVFLIGWRIVAAVMIRRR